ncbi:MAG: DUF2059 domain-containing protein [Cognaticolwellia sp.]
MKPLMLLFLLFPFFVNAEHITYQLLEANGAKALFAQSQGQMAKVMYLTDPELKAYSNLVEKWESTYFAWEKVRESLLPIYNKRFSEDELRELVSFYKQNKPKAFLNTATGKKFTALLPEINREFTLSGHRYMGEVMPMLYKMVGDTSKRLASDVKTDGI